MRDIKALLRHIVPYSDIFKALCYPCLYQQCQRVRAISRTLAYLEPETSSKSCQTCKHYDVISHIPRPNMVIKAYSSILKGIFGYSGILMYLLLVKPFILNNLQCSDNASVSVAVQCNDHMLCTASDTFGILSYSELCLFRYVKAY